MNETKKKEIIQKMFQNILLLFKNDEAREYIQIYLIDPLLNHVLERIFPYIVITSILFILLILATIRHSGFSQKEFFFTVLWITHIVGSAGLF